jgi:hypothetical protein
MARNEKRETVELRWRRIALVIFAVAGIATLTVGYTLQRRAHDALGNQILAVEADIKWRRAEVQTQRENLNRLQRKDALLRQVIEMHLDLVPIASSQRRAVPLLSGAGDAVVGVPSPTPRRDAPVGIGPRAAAVVPTSNRH